jgi:hypothetical protein
MDEGNMTEEPLVEDRVHDCAIVRAPLRAPLQAGSRRGFELGHG